MEKRWSARPTSPHSIVFFSAFTSSPGRLFLRFEVKRCRVHTVAQPGRPGTIRKYMAQMRIAARTARLGASHAVTGVGVFGDVLAVGGGKKTRPTRARIELCFRTKQ